MHLISPSLESTATSPDGREWVPADFSAFLAELQHITESCTGDDPAPLYRGQDNYTWPLNCLFVRNFIQSALGLQNYMHLNNEIRTSLPFHKTILSMLLLKFGVIGHPTKEAFDHELKSGIDPWFEFLKETQQYPERDSFIKGTFFIDWTHNHDVALYFANQTQEEDGSIWICDTVETGKILQEKKVAEILALMNENNFSDTPRGVPLLFHPLKQALHPRAVNQHVVYFAQMDYRYDLADIWIAQENQLDNRRIFIKLILPNNSFDECSDYLRSNGITQETVFPD